MTRNISAYVAAALALACLSPAAAQAPPAAETASRAAASVPSLFEHWKIQLDTGARNFDLYGDRPGKFLEYRDITRGFYVNGARLRFESPDSPYSFSFNASNVRELDESIKADV